VEGCHRLDLEEPFQFQPVQFVVDCPQSSIVGFASHPVHELATPSGHLPCEGDLVVDLVPQQGQDQRDVIPFQEAGEVMDLGHGFIHGRPDSVVMHAVPRSAKTLV